MTTDAQKYRCCEFPELFLTKFQVFHWLHLTMIKWCREWYVKFQGYPWQWQWYAKKAKCREWYMWNSRATLDNDNDTLKKLNVVNGICEILPIKKKRYIWNSKATLDNDNLPLVKISIMRFCRGNWRPMQSQQRANVEKFQDFFFFFEKQKFQDLIICHIFFFGFPQCVYTVYTRNRPFPRWVEPTVWKDALLVIVNRALLFPKGLYNTSSSCFRVSFKPAIESSKCLYNIWASSLPNYLWHVGLLQILQLLSPLTLLQILLLLWSGNTIYSY